MSSPLIKKVLVIGAGGTVGTSAIKALLEERFLVTGLTRQSSKTTLPAGVRHVKTDYSEASLLDAFKGQDAIVSTISPEGLPTQKLIIDAAIAAGVKVFLPSEYGVDTSIRSSPDVVPALGPKIETVDYLKSQQDKISWTVLITGSLFDWGLKIPSFGGWNIPARTVTIYDGGNIPYEATNLDQVGKAIAASLKNSELSKNQYVYVNSFTITQNEVLKAVEKATGEKFTVSQSTAEELWQDGAAKLKGGQKFGVLAMIASVFYGKGGLANYSVTRGLWNEKLDLPQENLDECLKKYVAGNQ